jgi:hypothetical protein
LCCSVGSLGATNLVIFQKPKFLHNLYLFRAVMLKFMRKQSVINSQR